VLDSSFSSGTNWGGGAGVVGDTGVAVDDAAGLVGLAMLLGISFAGLNTKLLVLAVKLGVEVDVPEPNLNAEGRINTRDCTKLGLPIGEHIFTGETYTIHYHINQTVLK